MAYGVRTGIIHIGDDGRSQRTALRAVAFAGDAMQLVIAVAYGLCGRASLVGRGRSLLQKIAIRIIAVGDNA
jgi:hypothetical protein